jgi:2-oxoglutarate dehydrogenase complex dehydrogenase (E1) component-like enzyme
MKLFFAFLLLTSSIYARVPLDMKTGYWEHQMDMTGNPMMVQAMAAMKTLPKAQRDQAMKSLNKKTYQCVTKEDMNNWEEKIKESLSKSKDINCEMKVLLSNKTKFEAAYKCEDKQRNFTVKLVMNSPTDGVTTLTSPMSPAPITTKMKWISKNCK